MRTVAVIAALLATSLPALAARNETLEQLVARAEAARPQDQPALYAEIAERKLNMADELYAAGNTDTAKAAVDDVVLYSDKASAAATQSGRKLKNTEIALRKMSERLRDMKRSLTFEDQGPLQAAADHLENLRTKLLSRMFGKEPK